MNESIIIYLLQTVLRFWKILSIVFLVAATTSAAISLMIPNEYKATAKVLPAANPSPLGLPGMTGGGASLKKIAAFSGGLLNGGTGGTYDYFAILYSRTTIDEVILKFNLIERYEVKKFKMDNARKIFLKNYNCDFDDNGAVFIDVTDKDPQVAADIANYVVEILNRRSNELSTQEARRNRELVERRVVMSQTRIRLYEDSLRRYLKEGNTVFSFSGTEGNPLGELFGMKERKEIEVAVYGKLLSKESAQVEQAIIELEEITKKLAKYPDSGIRFTRLYRELKTEETILQFLYPILEQSKVEEIKSAPVVLTLDEAEVPERKIKPARSLIVVVSTFFAVAVCLFYILLIDRNVFAILKTKLFAASLITRGNE
jgi:uncharacterized protein involved in exopolysaccharide biosynthesis